LVFIKPVCAKKLKTRDKKRAQKLKQQLTFLEAAHNAKRGSDARPRTGFLVAPAEGTHYEFKTKFSEQTNWHKLYSTRQTKKHSAQF
jgi:hypothetical protein